MSAPSPAPAPSPRQPTATHWLSGRGGSAPSFELELESDPSFDSVPVLLSPGDSFAGLEVRGKLGTGGMATVYRAWDPAEAREVALKVLNRGLVGDARHLARFRSEARLASLLRHPRIVTVLTYGELNGDAYLTMQLVEGPTLAEVLDADGPLAPREAARVVEQIARALDAAHQQRVVHRDLKPNNVVLDPAAGPLVLDFGLAKDLGRDGHLTATGELIGTPAFMAPEQALPPDGPADHRIDVHGLGGLLFASLTGRPPHAGETPLQIVQQLLQRDPPLLRTIDPTLPAELERVCARALARDPRDRYPTAAALADDLARFGAGDAVEARLPGYAQRLARAARRHPRTTAVAGCALALAAAGLVALRGSTARLARAQRSAQGTALLERAQAHARGLHADAERELLHAMLVTEGAFLEAPEQEGLREALVRVKRERAAHAEARGNWALAEELRQNLARLEGRPLAPEPERATRVATIDVGGLRPGAQVVFEVWRADGCAVVASASVDAPSVSIPPGRYVATHVAAGQATDRFLVVVDSGHHHTRSTSTTTWRLRPASSGSRRPRSCGRLPAHP